MAKRSKFNLSHFNLLTAKFGKIVPIGITDVLMGDTFKHSTSLLIRAQPMIAPIMHPVWVSVHHFFVPYRILWEEWEEFITGRETETPFPTISLDKAKKGDLFDYFNLPLTKSNLEVSAFPFMAYNLIFNEFYRDQDLIDEVPLDNTELLTRSWAKDYFTTARPFTQKGPEVTIPVDISADGPMLFGPSNDSAIKAPMTQTRTDVYTVPGYKAIGTYYTDGEYSGKMHYRGGLIGAGIPINDMRLALAVQRYEEARARYGSRYAEYLNFYGIKHSDARLQRPEYLGGGKQILQFSEVLGTSSDNLGKLGGHGLGVMKSNDYVKYFEEHGIVISLMSILPKSMYIEGVDRPWLKRSHLDYYVKELAFLGQQEVYKEELYVSSSANAEDRTLFGYQDRFDEYRSHQSKVAGDFRDTLDYWHLARKFGASPSLNASFINCNPDQQRVFVDGVSDPFLIMANHNLKARRICIPNANPKTF